MNKIEVEKWCLENNYIIIDLNKKEIPIETVFKIAMEATGVNDIVKHNRKPEYSFARFIAANYLDGFYATGILAKKLKIHHSVIDYARKTLSVDIRYFKPWQQKAIIYFNKKIAEITKNLQTNG